MLLFYNIPKNFKVIKSNIIIKRLAKYFVSLGLNKKLDGMNPILTGLFYRFKNDICYMYMI